MGKVIIWFSSEISVHTAKNWVGFLNQSSIMKYSWSNGKNTIQNQLNHWQTEHLGELFNLCSPQLPHPLNERTGCMSC